MALNIKTPRAFQTSVTTTLRKWLNATKVELSENNLFPLKILFLGVLFRCIRQVTQKCCLLRPVRSADLFLFIELEDNNNNFFQSNTTIFYSLTY
jgi:hypothetical protein